MPLTSQELQSKLWQAADILRGQINSADYKNYIFSMLFLKRLSNRFDEEVAIAVAAGVPRAAAVADPDEHQFAVPETAHWRQIVKATMSLGEALNIASHEIEDANAGRIDGVLTGTNWNERVQAGQPGQPGAHHPQPAHPLQRPGPAGCQLRRRRRRHRQRAGRRLRVPYLPVRRRRGQKGRRVLHTALGGAADC